MKRETELRRKMIAITRSLFARGYAVGSAGNISARCGEGVLITPTESSFETVTAHSIAKVDLDGNVVGGSRPSKEIPFHLAIYRAKPDVTAVVHLHSTYAVAVSCLRDLNMEDALSALTPYYTMRVGHLPVVGYYPPGDHHLGPAVAEKIRTAPAVLLRNHGPITTGGSLAEAVALAEEIEEQAKLHILLGERAQPLTKVQVQKLGKR